MPVNNPSNNGTWLETDEFRETILALQLTSEQLSNLVTTGNLHYWTWVIVCLHNALQGFMVLALRGTNNINVLSEDCAIEWLASHERGDGQYPEQKLDKFLNLYKKVKSERMKMYINSQSLKPSVTQGRSVKKLNSFRNDFIHFVPKGRVVEVSDLPQIVDDCLNIIWFLAFECGNIFWREQEQEYLTKVLLERSKRSISRIKQLNGG